jgi:uncharacterized membrane protein
MGLFLWASVAGALLCWVAGDFSLVGLVLGGFFGAAMGVWLQTIVQREIRDAVSAALADGDFRPSVQSAAPSARVAPVAVAEPPSPPEPAVATQPSALRPAVIVATPRAPAAPIGETTATPAAGDDDQPFTAPSDPVELLVNRAREWLFGGNTIVRAGLAILFVGLVFLARLVAKAGLLPLEVRLAMVAAVGLVLLVIGFLKRVERPDFGLSLQGAGVAILYLVTFAAARTFGVMPPLAAFAFMILFAALGCTLALMQNALPLAMVSFLGGFAVPVLLGGQSETPLGLFTYITILNLAILIIAWRRSWRPLNLLGFAATFLIATAWGTSAYEPQHYLLCQLFLIITIAIYLATALLYAHNTPGKYGNYADSALLFGTALVGFGLQAGLVSDRPFATAFSALGFGAVYLATAAIALRRRQADQRVLTECLIAIGIGFVTLAVPLALDADWAAATWAIEGAGALWVGMRQARWMPRAFGLLLQALAALMVLGALPPNISRIAIANSAFIVPLLVAAALLFGAWLIRKPLDHSGSSLAKLYAPFEYQLSKPWFLAGFLFLCIAIEREATRMLPALRADEGPITALPTPLPGFAFVIAVLGAMLASLVVARRLDWPVARWPSRLSLPLIFLCFLFMTFDGRDILSFPELICWIIVLALHFWMLREQPVSRWTKAMHVGGVLLATMMVAQCLAQAIDHGALWETSWAGVINLVSVTAIIGALIRWAGVAAPLASTDGLSWPRDPFAKAYWWYSAACLALFCYGGAMIMTLNAQGVTDPLPYIPLLNPVDLSSLLALGVLALWRRMVATANPLPKGADILTGTAGLTAGAVLGFAIINMIWLRTAHHFLGISWDSGALAASQTVQAGLSIIWSLIAMGLMFFAHRRAERLPWLSGAVLLGVVVIKLLFIDMSSAEGFARIIAFIGVGVLMLLTGYFVPLPPRKQQEQEQGQAS